MSTPDADDASRSPDYSSADDADADADMAADQKTDPSGDNSPDQKPSTKSSNAKDPTRPRRKKARRACFACQRAHLTCGECAMFIVDGTIVPSRIDSSLT